MIKAHNELQPELQINNVLKDLRALKGIVRNELHIDDSEWEESLKKFSLYTPMYNSSSDSEEKKANDKEKT